MVALVGCSKVSTETKYEPKYKIGDCFKYSEIYKGKQGEFIKEKDTIIELKYKVINIGKKSYLTHYGYGLQSEEQIQSVDNSGRYQKIECPEEL